MSNFADEIDRWLRSDVEAAGEAETALWETMNPMNFELFDHYWSIISPDDSIFDTNDLESVQWSDSSHNYDGMIIAGTDDANTGVLRIIEPDGSIEEATFFEGQRHGLSRKEITEDLDTYVHVQLFNNG